MRAINEAYYATRFTAYHSALSCQKQQCCLTTCCCAISGTSFRLEASTVDTSSQLVAGCSTASVRLTLAVVKSGSIRDHNWALEPMERPLKPGPLIDHQVTSVTSRRTLGSENLRRLPSSARA